MTLGVLGRVRSWLRGTSRGLDFDTMSRTSSGCRPRGFRHGVKDRMPVTLTTLISQPALGLVVLAASHALEREISWVHTSELVDPTPYLTGGELVLSVGLWLGSGPAAEREAGAHVTAYVDRLVQAQVAALGF